MAFKGTKSAILASLASLLLPDGAGNLLAAQSPAQFDISTKLATTQFVQLAQGSRRSITGMAANYTATASDVGRVFAANATGLTLTLPLSTSLTNGSVVSSYANIPSGTFTIVTQGSDKMSAGGPSQSLTSVTLNYGEGCDWITDAAGNWYAVSRNALLGSTGSFVNSLYGNGYQKLPGGLIVQWGQAACAAGTTSTANFPISFPNQCLNVGGSGNNATGNTQAYTTVNSKGQSSFNWSAFLATGGSTPVLAATAGSVQMWYFAVGY